MAQALQADAESQAAQSKPCRREADELDAEGEAALAQLRQAARQLLGMVSLTSGPAAAARLADVSMFVMLGNRWRRHDRPRLGIHMLAV